MAHKVVRGCFDKYHRARLEYVSEVADLATKPHYLEALLEEGTVIELKRLLHDRLPTVQQTAATALGRLASYSPELAAELVASDTMTELVASMAEDAAAAHLRAAAGVVRAVARHNADLAAAAVESGAAEVLTGCLDAVDSGVRESAAVALGCIASHSAELANAVVEAGAVPLLAANTREPRVSLKRAAVSALGEIAKHNPETADVVVASGVLPILTKQLTADDAGVRRAVTSALAHMVKHSAELAGSVVEAGAFPALLHLLQDGAVEVQRTAAATVREVVKHSEELASLVVASSGLGYLVDYAAEARGNAVLPAVVALGYLGSYSPTLGMAVLRANACAVLKSVLINEPEDHIKAASAWALGQVGKHGAEHAQVLAEADTLRHLLAAALHEDASADLRGKARRALGAAVANCRYLPAMTPLLPIAPVPTRRALLARYVEVLPEDPSARRTLVSSGGLKVIMSLDDSDPQVAELIAGIADNFPAEVVEYCSPAFAAQLAERVDTDTVQGLQMLRQSGQL